MMHKIVSTGTMITDQSTGPELNSGQGGLPQALPETLQGLQQEKRRLFDLLSRTGALIRNIKQTVAAKKAAAAQFEASSAALVKANRHLDEFSTLDDAERYKKHHGFALNILGDPTLSNEKTKKGLSSPLWSFRHEKREPKVAKVFDYNILQHNWRFWILQAIEDSYALTCKQLIFRAMQTIQDEHQMAFLDHLVSTSTTSTTYKSLATCAADVKDTIQAHQKHVEQKQEAQSNKTKSEQHLQALQGQKRQLEDRLTQVNKKIGELSNCTIQ